MRHKTVFVLGAGFSCHGGIPLVQQLRAEVLQWIEANKNRDLLKTYPFTLPEPGYPQGKFRAGLEFVDRGQGFEELLIDLKRAVSECPVAFQTYTVLRRACVLLLWEKHQGLRQRLADVYSCFARQVTSVLGVISLNWDLVCETALEREGRAWSYAPGSRIPIIKPHGSINWTNHLQARQDCLIETPPGFSPIADGMTISCYTCNPFEDPLLPYDDESLRHMLFPGDPEVLDIDGEGVQKDVGKLWEAARALILSAEQVVFIGYSLPAYDQFAKELFQFACRGKRILVCNPSPDVIRTFEQTFPGEEIEPIPLRFEESQFGKIPPM